MNNAVVVSDLSFSYDHLPILEEASLEIPSGSLIGIIGPNGGGKTTLLKLLMGFLSPTKGSIEVLGTTPVRARKNIGYVPQIHKCDREFPITVEELVLLGALPDQSSSIRKKSEDLLEELGLLSHKKQPFGALSGGLAQRALLARALLADPSLLILDEPTANVDPASTLLIVRKLSKMRGEKTILIVTHDLNTIIEGVDQILCVQGNITPYPKEKLCEHFSIGLYHTPLLNPGNHAPLSR